MITAKSARALILGASLLALVFPMAATAEVSESSTRAITTGGVDAITTGGVDAITTGGVNAITTGGVDAITTGGINAITTGGVDAITTGGIASMACSSSGVSGFSLGGNSKDSSSVRAITTGGVAAITTGGVDAITTGGVNAITTGGVAAITTGGINAITTGGVAAITTGGVSAITTGGVDAITTGGVRSGCLMLAGPVTSLDIGGGSFESMGQTVYAEPSAIAGLQVGDYIGVGGAVIGAGEIAGGTVLRFNTPYIAGASDVIVSGIPTSVNSHNGEVSVGQLTADYTQALSGTYQGIGGVVTLVGTQPVDGGKMLSRSVLDTTRVFFE